MQKFLSIALVATCFALSASAANNLMKNAKPACSIVLRQDAGPATRHAAEELALYLGKIAGGEKPAIGTTPVDGMYPVTFELVKDGKIEKEGFALVADKNGLRIQAQREIGHLYGAYEILKKYGGIRWLVPGDDGEYFTAKPTIEVPDQISYCNPAARIRMFHFCSADYDSPAIETSDWMIRNNMRLHTSNNLFHHPRLEKMNIYRPRAAVSVDGWHCYSRLLLGVGTKVKASDAKKAAEELFKEHPEYFPLVGGKRVITYGATGPQPCTSNPEVVKLMAQNLVAHIKKIREDLPENYYILVNNDTTTWCECDQCKKADDPEEKKNGQIPTRVWTFLNALAAETFKLLPDAPIWGYAYQNYHAVPRGVKPDPRMHVMLAFNDQCYRHKLADTNCPVNRRFLQYYKDWVKTGETLSTWEELPSSGGSYMPIEEIYVANIKTYRELGVGGTMPELFPLFGLTGPVRKSRMDDVAWLAMWQALYLGAQFLWDADADYDQLYEEANTLYYGKAWQAGMRDYRKLLTKAYTSSSGCFGYQHHNPAGRMLTQPGVEKELLEYLDKAEKAVKDDPRSLNHVQMDRKLFGYHWQRTHELFVKNYRELHVYAKTAPIAIDGNIDEQDWQNADIMSNYKSNESMAAQRQTQLRAVYEPDNLYIAIEVMEPCPDKMKSGAANVWDDNNVELYLNYPDMGDKYYHFIITHKGVVWQKKITPGESPAVFDSAAEIKTKVLKDRWMVEMRIPANTLGMKCFTGQTWRLNSGRYRVVEGEPNESSSLLGTGGGNLPVETFIPLSFSGERSSGGATKRE